MTNLKPYLDGLTWQDVLYRGKIVFKTCWLVADLCLCSYNYGKQSIPCSPFDDIMTQLTNKIEELSGHIQGYFNSCNINAYSDPTSCVDWHSDNEALFRESEWKRDVSIVSLSLGGTRIMMFRQKLGEAKQQITHNDGDLAFMGGRLQDTFYHRVPPYDAASCGEFAPRANLTWRSVRRHSKGCPLKTAAI